jgi:hypothetical protein
MTRIPGLPELMFLPVMILCWSATDARAADAPNLCFDLSKPNTIPLRPEPANYPAEGLETVEKGLKDDASGKERIAWASLQGVVHAPLSNVLQRLQDPMTTRDPGSTEVKVTSVPEPGALLKQSIRVVVKPVFFLTIEWVEAWTFVILEGSAADPKKILISYQKTAGTSHIRRFCGSILLQKVNPNLTGISHHEEIIADRRSPGDVANGMIGTLRTLRK